jgi:predicted Zn-dependent peptidase
MVADILQNPVFSAEELAKEQDVVIQEIGEAADTPDDVVFELLQEESWAPNPLARPILGTPGTVRAQTPESLRGFMARHYRPEDMIVAAAGKVDIDAFAQLAERYFGAAGPAPERSKREIPAFKGGLRHDARKIEQTHLALAFPGVSARHDEFFATRIFADILGGGMSSRLFQAIREQRGLAYSVYAFADGYDLCGLVGAYAAADEDRIAETAGIIRMQMEDLAQAPGQKEIDRARAMLRASLMMSLENPAARLEAAVGQLFTLGRVLSPEEILDRLNAVARDDIRNCAARALSGPFSAALVGPGDMAAVEKALRR